MKLKKHMKKNIRLKKCFFLHDETFFECTHSRILEFGRKKVYAKIYLKKCVRSKFKAVSVEEIFSAKIIQGIISSILMEVKRWFGDDIRKMNNIIRDEHL